MSYPESSASVDPGSPSGALILGGAHGSLAIARSLGRRGIPVRFATHDHPLTRFSRYVSHSERWPGPSEPRALEWLLHAAERDGLQGWTLFVCGDAEVLFAARHHAALSAVFRLTTPPWAVTRWALDKRLTHQLAADLGLHAPATCYPQSRDEIERLACTFPVILKPAMREERNAFTQAKAWRIDTREQLLARYVEAAALVGEQAIMVQELIPGGGERQFSFAALCDRGEAVASLVARRTRQFPVDFGYTSTFVESIAQDEVESAARKILHSLDYSGLVEVEFKLDVRDGRYKLLDINARPWTWIGLGASAGVDFPYCAWQLACGQAPVPARARLGARWMHATRDLVAVAQGMMAGCASPFDYLRAFRRPLTFAAFAADDPLPGLAELPLVAARMLERALPLPWRGGQRATATAARPAG